MCNAGRTDHAYAFQVDPLYVQVVEQPDALSEQERRHVNMDLVHPPQVEALLQDAGGAHDDILVPCGLFCLTNGPFNPIGDKGERRPFLDPFLWG